MTYSFFSSSAAARKKSVSTTKHPSTTTTTTTTRLPVNNTTAVALPLQLPEILHLIFSFLSEHSIRHSARFVCKQWLAVSRPFVQVSARWRDRITRDYKHGFILNRLHHITILRVLFEQTWQLENTQFAWRELGDKIDALRDKGQLRVWKLELNGGNFLESRIYSILPRISTLTHLRIERMVQQAVHVGVILAVAPQLKKLHIEGTKGQPHTIELDTTPAWSTRNGSPSSDTSFLDSHVESGLVNLTIRWMSIDQLTLESIINRCPQLLTLRLIELGQTTSQEEPFDRSRIFSEVASSCPHLSWFHLSFEGQVMTREESIAFTETFYTHKQEESIAAMNRRMKQRPTSPSVMSVLSNDIRPETHLQLFRTHAVHVNTITTLEICLGNGLLLSRYVSHTLHDFLCSSPWLQHLIAPMIPYYAEYLDLEGPVDPVSESYHPRKCRPGKQPMDLFRTRKRIWACRGLKTLRIQFESMEGDYASEENARIMFGYLVRVCPDLRELSIRRRQLNLKLDGGLCLLTRLRKLERLMIWTDTWTKLSKKDLEWMARHPHHKKSMEQWFGLGTGTSRSYKRAEEYRNQDSRGKASSSTGMAVRKTSWASTSSSSSNGSRTDAQNGGGSRAGDDKDTGNDLGSSLTLDDMMDVGTMADIEAWQREQTWLQRRRSGSRRSGQLISSRQQQSKERYAEQEEDEGLCWPKLEFLGLQLVFVQKDQPVKLEEHLVPMMARIRPETVFSCEATRWHELN
ncbi:hypothetical protein BGX29_000474 [Mortierella sp. GBA35]|nr:hypothetical protein BGX29_000474 [Mortierella sp. GBA35]